MPDTVAIRKRLARKGLMACPRTLNYPLDTKAHAKSAMGYYNHANTVKCKGGMMRICRAYRKHGLTDTEGFKEHCR